MGWKNMNKNLVFVGIAVLLLLVVGLSGCIGGTSIKDIQEHPNNYLDKEVTIQAFYGGKITSGDTGRYFIYQKKFLSDSIDKTINVYFDNNVDKSDLINGGEYKFTGIIKSEETIYESTILYLLVSKITPV